MDCGKEGQQKPLPRSEKGVARSESTLLIFAEVSRPRPDLAPGRGASQPHRLPWLHRAVPSATLDERHGRPQLLELIGRTCPTVKDILDCFFNTQGEPTARACSGLSPPLTLTPPTFRTHIPDIEPVPKQEPVPGSGCRQPACVDKLQPVPISGMFPGSWRRRPSTLATQTLAPRDQRPGAGGDL